MALTTFELSGVAHSGDGSVLSAATVHIQLVDQRGNPAADFFTGSPSGAQLPIAVTDVTDANGAWAVSLPSNLDGNQDTRYRVRIVDPATRLALVDEIVQMPRADSVLSALVDATAVTPSPQSAAAAEVAKAAEWANKPEDVLVSAAAGGDEADDYSARHFAAKAAASAGGVADQVAAASNHRTTAERFASAAEDVEVVDADTSTGTGLFSALHHAAKAAAQVVLAAAQATLAGHRETTAARFASAAEDVEVVDAETGLSTGLFSALHYAAKAAASAVAAAASNTAAGLRVNYAAEWANKAEDALVSADAGGDEVDDYSAKHFAAKASADRTFVADNLANALFVLEQDGGRLRVATGTGYTPTIVTQADGIRTMRLTLPE
jgi:hypothetical protein